MRWLTAAIHALTHWANAIATSAIFLILVIINADVAGRSALNRAVPGSLELASALMAFVVMLALARAEQARAHMRILLLDEWLSPRVLAALDILAYLLGIALAVLIVVQTWGVAVRSLVRWELLPGILSLPIFPAYFMVPIGVGLLVLQYVFGLTRSVRVLIAGPDDAELAR